MSDPLSPSPKFILPHDGLILVTGSNGFIGVKVVQGLLAAGFRNLRCFVRPSSQLDRLNYVLREVGGPAKIEIITGDLVSPEDCARAAQGVSVIYNLAAGFNKSFADVSRNSVQGTKNLLEAFATRGRPVRFVHVSSFAVYSNLHLPRGAPLDEASPLEDSPQERFDAYAFGKLRQEEIIREYGATRNVPFVILRPGTVFGPGKRDLTGRIGLRRSRLFVHVGGSNLLPLTFVDNCADAIVLAGLRPGVDGETFNVVDDDLLTSRQFLRAFRDKVGGFIIVPLPYFAAYFLCAMWESVSRLIKKLPPVFNRRRCAAEWKGNRFPNRKLHERLGWAPRVAMADAMKAFLAQFETKAG